MAERRRSSQVSPLAAALFLCTTAIFLPVSGHKFLSYDDGLYVAENRHVREGIRGRGVVWAFTTGHAGNWHPLTWLSHMADTTLFGAGPRGPHLVSVGMHAAAAAILLVVLAGMTGAVWRSAVVAALFAVHPLRVESVAWIAERKDVLSALFFTLTLAAYLRYARRPSVGRYLLVAASFAAGLAAKSMLVTLPFGLLLLDFWPLGRLGGGMRGGGNQPGNARHPPLRLVLLEKLPLVLAAAAAAFLTWRAQRLWGAFRSFDLIPFGSRIVNAVVAAAIYLARTFLPVDLVYFYPHRLAAIPPSEALAAVALVAGLTAGALWLVRNHPTLATGWLLYLGMLVPVSGLVQVGSQAMADRYTYLPHVGLLISAVWGAAAGARRWRIPPAVGVAAGLCAIAVCAILTRRQIAVWRDDEALFGHALSVDASNWRAANDLGGVLLGRGEISRAVDLFKEALRMQPGYAEAHLNLGNALYRQGRAQEAIVHFQQVLRIKPDFTEAQTSLGAALWSLGRKQEAVACYEAVLRVDPESAEAVNNLGISLAEERRYGEAEEHFRRAVALKPGFTLPLFNLGTILEIQRRREDAVAAYRRILAIDPGNIEAQEALRKAQSPPP